MRIRISKRDLILCAISILVVAYFEWIYPSQAFNECVWPLGDEAKNIAIIADPQIIDENTYPGRPAILRWITEVITDRYMARNFRLMHSKLKPDAIVFLGDLFDGGREWENKVWSKEYNRYRKVFPLSSSVLHIENLPGNHDVGSGDDIIPNAYDRFQRHFGKSNQVFSIADHTLVTLDTNALMNQIRPDIYKPARTMLESLKEKKNENSPTILFTHVPFYRQDGGYCGFEREGKPFSWVRGKQYITEITPDLTNEILQGVEPVYVFSGDDHDVCKFTHRWGTEGSCEEHTVKSFSMAMGIKRPGFQVLSLGPRKSHKTDTCLTAKPFTPIIGQAVAFSVIGLTLLIFAFCGRRRNSNYSPLPLPISSRDDKGHKRANQDRNLRFSKQDLIKSVGIVAISWAAAQVVIGILSYKQL